jgi:hypothetical protein
VTSAAILARLRDVGVTAMARGDRLVLRPASGIPPDLLAEVGVHKGEVLTLLIAPTNDARPVPPAAPSPPLARPEPPPEPVERLARAMAAPRPWQRVTDPERGLAYFRGQARNRLTTLDPIARGLLVQAEEGAARRHGGRER